MNDRQLQKIIEYTNEFGTESRNTIILRKYLPFLIENPLKNVYKAVMYTAEYSINEFNTLFPELQSLHINSEKCGIYMKQQLSNVKELYFGDEVNHSQINNNDILLAMQLNPQIQKLVISTVYFDDAFKLEVNDQKIKLICKFGRFGNLFQIIRPEQFEEMYVDSSWIAVASKGFIERFTELKSLTMMMNDENLEMLCNKVAKLQVLRVIVITGDWIYDRHIVDFLASTAIRKLSTFSIHFYCEHESEKFYNSTIQSVNMALWRITLNEDEPEVPKRYKFSIVLKKIKDM